MEEEDVRGDRGLSVFRLRAVSRLTLVVRCTEIGYSVSTQVLGFRFGCGWCCVVGFLFGCCWFCVLLLCVSAWWNRGIADEVTMASYGRAVTGTAVMARSANEEKKNPFPSLGFSFSFVDFAVFDLMSGSLSKHSLISLNSTRTLNSWLAISVLIALTSAGCLAISASQCLPLAISRICALLDFKVLALVTVAITTLASHLGIQSFPLSTFTISPAFPKAFWT